MALTREGTRLEHRTAAVQQDGTARAQPGAAGRAEQERRVPQKPRRLRIGVRGRWPETLGNEAVLSTFFSSEALYLKSSFIWS